MKTKRYWLRGALIVLVIVIVVHIIMMLMKLDYSPLQLPGLFATFAVLQNSGCFSWSGNEPYYCKAAANIVNILTNVIFYFIVGSLFGWVYGKIKSRGTTTI